MKKMILNCLILPPVTINAQVKSEISGQVRDLLTNQPLYESHVYLDEHIGVLTDQNGLFKIEVPDNFENGKLYISYVGYETFLKDVKDFKQDFQQINLIQETVMLDAVVVSPDPWDKFRDAVTDLFANYDDRKELYSDMYSELGKIDPQLQGTKKAGAPFDVWPFVLIIAIISSALIFMIRPLLHRYTNIKFHQ